MPALSPSTRAVWPSSASSPSYAFFRPASDPFPPANASRLAILVSAAPDIENKGKILGLYKLYVNSELVGVGPGTAAKLYAETNSRSTLPSSHTSSSSRSSLGQGPR